MIMKMVMGAFVDKEFYWDFLSPFVYKLCAGTHIGMTGPLTAIELGLPSPAQPPPLLSRPFPCLY